MSSTLSTLFYQWCHNQESLNSDQLEILTKAGLDPNQIIIPIDKQALQQAIDFSIIEVVCTTPSTQKQVKPNSTLIAEHQSAGVGQNNRSWLTPLARSVCLSHRFILPLSMTSMSGFTLAIALAVIKTIKHFAHTSVTIKWPNDLYNHNNKFAGILTEAKTLNKHQVEVTLGIGINWQLSAKQLNIISQPATNIPLDTQSISRTTFIIQLLKDIKNSCETFCQFGFTSFIDDWSQHDHLVNQIITLQDRTHSHTGQYIGIDEQGKLLLQTGSGIHSFTSGTILSSNKSS